MATIFLILSLCAKINAEQDCTSISNSQLRQDCSLNNRLQAKERSAKRYSLTPIGNNRHLLMVIEKDGRFRTLSLNETLNHRLFKADQHGRLALLIRDKDSLYRELLPAEASGYRKITPRERSLRGVQTLEEIFDSYKRNTDHLDIIYDLEVQPEKQGYFETGLPGLNVRPGASSTRRSPFY